MATQYAFLSTEWIEEARRIADDYRDRMPEIPHGVRLNQIVTRVPFGEGVIRAHVDTSSGGLVVELGHLNEPDITVTTDYDTARTIFVEGDMQAAMQAFMSGRVQVQGDMTKVLAIQQRSADAVSAEVRDRVREITA